jgi:hypothetical protein
MNMRRPHEMRSPHATGLTGYVLPSQAESVPMTPSPERPEQAPHDVPDPGPQALAWARALQVVHGRAH